MRFPNFSIKSTKMKQFRNLFLCMRFVYLIVIFLLFSVPSFCYAQQIYIWTDEKGIKHYTQEPPPEGIRAKERSEIKDTVPEMSDSIKEEKSEQTEKEKSGQTEKTEETVTKDPNKAAKEEKEQLYKDGFEALQDIRILLDGSGLTFKLYDEFIIKASLSVSRLENDLRGEKLKEILNWYNIARDCWYNSNNGSSFDLYFSQLSNKMNNMLKSKFNKQLKSWIEARQVIWTENERLLDEYDRYFKRR